MNNWRKPVLVMFLWSRTSCAAFADEIGLTSEANVMIELTFTASRTYADPFNEVALDVAFIDPTGRELRVPAFWAGKNVWKVRYSSPVVGTHRFRSKHPEAVDKGLHDVTGTVKVKPYAGDNPLYQHGPLRMSPSRRYLEHRDGTPFFWLGDTWWMGLCHRLHWPEDFQKLAADRKEKGFNVIQIVAGLYPDMPPFDPRGANEAGFPWEKDYARIRPEYFDAVDQRLGYLVEQGFTPCLVGAWGYFVKFMGVEKAKQHWRNLVARYGAWPVVWCVAGEANLPYYLAKGFPYDDREQVSGWTEVTRYLRDLDPFHRPTTIHPTGIGRLSARHAMNDLSLLDFDLLQTPHGQRDAVAPTVRTMRECYADTPILPIINGEAAYQMLSDTLPTAWTRRMFWLCLMNGAAGHTYGANGIWQVNRKGEPHGPSPHHAPGSNGYGVIPWDEAMNLPGSRQVGLGKKLLEQFPWHKFEPHPEWATFSGQSSLSLEGCHWIWFPEGNPAQNAPAGQRFFRRRFALPDGKTIESARLRLSADDRFSVQLNGETVGASSPGTDTWKSGKQFNDVARLLKPGTNILAIVAENMPAPAANPAGLIVRLEVRFAGGESFALVSDSGWLSAKSDVPGWERASLDDKTWDRALVIGKYGDGPWGPIDPLDNSDVYGPQAAGIPEVVRIIYVPASAPIVVHGLGRNAAYAATSYDPVTGAKAAPVAGEVNTAGSQMFSPPPGIAHDWVLILEAKNRPSR